MRQLLYLILFIFAARWLVKTMRAAQTQAAARAGAPGSSAGGGFGARAARPASAASAPPPLAAEPMVRCASCGVHAPASDSIVVGQQHFCCADHARQYAARPAGRDAR
jgi:uncharacterized protein